MACSHAYPDSHHWAHAQHFGASWERHFSVTLHGYKFASLNALAHGLAFQVCLLRVLQALRVMLDAVLVAEQSSCGMPLGRGAWRAHLVGTCCWTTFSRAAGWQTRRAVRRQCSDSGSHQQHSRVSVVRLCTARQLGSARGICLHALACSAGLIVSRQLVRLWCKMFRSWWYEVLQTSSASF